MSKELLTKLKVVSVFAGGGGLDLGLEVTGFATIFATDIDANSCATLRTAKSHKVANANGIFSNTHIVNTDIQNVRADSIYNTTNTCKGEVDLLVGGPPCQAFSHSGKRLGTQDPRGNLIFEYTRLLAELSPMVFIFENVVGLTTVESGQTYEALLTTLSNPKLGLYYELTVLRLNAVDYGVPQFRNRIVIIGHREGRKILSIPQLTGDPEEELADNLLPWRTVEDAFRNLPSPGNSQIANHVGRKHSQTIIDRYASLAPGERDQATRINKLNLKRPSFTIIVGSDKGGGKGHIHPIIPREVTPRESARIQTFPDWWAFSGASSRHAIKQIGNAVPPLLSAAIANQIRESFFCLPRVPITEILKKLDQLHLLRRGELKRLKKHFQNNH